MLKSSRTSFTRLNEEGLMNRLILSKETGVCSLLVLDAKLKAAKEKAKKLRSATNS
jgi:hypothetical protein